MIWYVDDVCIVLHRADVRVFALFYTHQTAKTKLCGLAQGRATVLSLSAVRERAGCAPRSLRWLSCEVIRASLGRFRCVLYVRVYVTGSQQNG